ncbi:MAG: serine hydrolase, partial [Mycobacterium sp.]|nr:serine hydrolase [Mycobacterium sp.]
MGRLLAAVAASLTVIATSAVAVSTPASAEPNIQPVGSVEIPDGPAQGWIVADIDTGTVLAGREMYGARPPASTIKVLLALTALDELNLDSTVVASPAAANTECNCAGLVAGRTYTVRQLLEAALLVSGNDAAHALADMLGGYDIAVDKMNAKAFAVGASDTHATSPSGLDGPGGAGWTTPRDLAVIFRAAMANPVFAQITAQPTAVFPAETGERVLVNQDELLIRYPGAIGGKTGFTDAARKTFVGAAQRDGRR